MTSRFLFLLKRAFTEHPRSAGESYLQHWRFTTIMSMRMAFVSFAIMIHGFFPFLFTRTASNNIEKIYHIMKTRVPKQGGE